MSSELAAANHDLVEPNPRTSMLGGLWRLSTDVRTYRHLVSNFIQRDLRLKYRSSTLGYFWSILEPLLLSAVYVVLFTIVAGKPEPRYPLWVVIGVITWGFFSRSLTASLTTLTGHEGLIKQVYFPRALFALTATGSQLVMTALSLLVAIPFMIYFGIVPTVGLLMVPAGLLLVALFAVGVGLGLACMNVVFRDIEFLFRFITRAGLYLSPVMWTVEMVPEGRAEIAHYNPVALPITMIRNGIDGRPLAFETTHIVFSIAVCVLSFVVGVMVFQRFEADVVKKI